MIPIMYLRRLFSSPPVPKVERVRWDRYNIALGQKYCAGTDIILRAGTDMIPIMYLFSSPLVPRLERVRERALEPISPNGNHAFCFKVPKKP
jgi:hypothetical protein